MLRFLETGAIDVYAKHVLIEVDGVWRAARVKDGYYLLAKFTEPNRHYGIVDEAGLIALQETGTVTTQVVADHPAVMLLHAPDDVRPDTVRYGRRDTLGYKPFAFVDGFSAEAFHARAVLNDFAQDDLPDDVALKELG